MKLGQGVFPIATGSRRTGSDNAKHEGRNVEDHPNESISNCAIFPENKFAHSIMTITLFYYVLFIFIFGLKYRVSKIMLLKGLSENFISIVLISYTHSSTHSKCYFERN